MKVVLIWINLATWQTSFCLNLTSWCQVWTKSTENKTSSNPKYPSKSSIAKMTLATSFSLPLPTTKNRISQVYTKIKIVNSLRNLRRIKSCFKTSLGSKWNKKKSRSIRMVMVISSLWLLISKLIKVIGRTYMSSIMNVNNKSKNNTKHWPQT